MKVLVFPHHLEIGGSQTNAIDLATAVRDQFGHEMVFCATPGPAGELIAERGFRLIELARPKATPSPTLLRQVHTAVRDEQPDLLHAYDNQQIFDAFYGAHLIGRMPVLATNMSMAVQTWLPRTIPITYGTAALAEEAKATQNAPVWLLEPPVDTDVHAPGAVDPSAFRAEWQLDDGSITIVVVSRLVSWMKAEGIRRAIDAVAALATTRRIRFVIVGGGTAYDDLAARADEVNHAAGCRLVVMTGPLIDPKPAYAAADIVIGMGGSILRGMAFAKPAVILGEEGFSEAFTPETASLFLREGMYGLGGGAPSDLAGQLAGLIDDADARSQLGAYARSQVVARFGLVASAAALDDMYRQTISWQQPVARQWADAATTLVRCAASQLPAPVKDRVRRLTRAH